MNNLLKTIFFKLSYNLTLRKFANIIFKYFPKLKLKLIKLRDSSTNKNLEQSVYYDSNVLHNIKKEIETKRENK